MLLTFSLFVCKAQINYQPGYAILNDGTRISGSIRVYDDEPWTNQRFIWLKDSAAFAADPKVRAKKYKVDDLKFYMVASRAFDKVHFVDVGNLQLKSLGTNDHMMERLAIGRITAHRFYSYPADFDVIYARNDEDLKAQEQKKKDDIVKAYKILLIKDNETKPQDAFDTDMPKYLGEVPEVSQKFQNGAYGNEPTTPKKGLAAKMISMARKTTFKSNEADAVIAAVNEYNQKSPVKK